MTSIFVIPAQAGTHLEVVPVTRGQEMGPRLRGGDEGLWGEALEACE
jgi:hypothetical protein